MFESNFSLHLTSMRGCDRIQSMMFRLLSASAIVSLTLAATAPQLYAQAPGGSPQAHAQDHAPPTSQAPVAARAKAADPGQNQAGPAQDPFMKLVRVIEVAKLPPLKSVRRRAPGTVDDRDGRKRITVMIKTRPSGASVRWGRRVIGSTPLRMVAAEGSTPADLVIQKSGYMILRTRIHRRASRSYTFQLTPAKFR